MKSIKLSAIFVIFFALSASIYAQTATVENSLLWKVSGKDLSTPSYLFGTIHILPAADYYFPEYMQKTFKSCKTLALEVDMVNLGLKEQIAMAKRVLMPAGDSVKNYLSKDEYERYKSYIINDLKIKEKKFNQMMMVQPLFSSGILLNELIKKPKGYETELGKMSKKQKMNVIGLETIDSQFKIFESISIKDQVEAMNFADISKNPMDEYNEMKSIYLNQQLDKLLEMTSEETSIPDFAERFLNQRNRNWIPVIEEQIRKNATFIAVGAAHLAGEQGIVNLLRLQGYTVEPILK